MKEKLLTTLILLIFPWGGCTSMAQEPQSSYSLGGQKLELQCDAFLMVLDRGRGPVFTLPGQCSGVPASVKDYQEHPDTWMYTDEYRRTYGDHHVSPKPAFRGFVPKGTVLTVQKIKKRRSFGGGPYVEVWVSVDNPAYEGVTAGLSSLVRGCVGENPDPAPREGYLRVVTDAASSN